MRVNQPVVENWGNGKKKIDNFPHFMVAVAGLQGEITTKDVGSIICLLFQSIQLVLFIT